MVDATGLTGRYEISLYWTTGNNLRAGAEPADSTAAGPDLKRALQEQLGLRVKSKKGPIEFVVVDHAEKTPSENRFRMTLVPFSPDHKQERLIESS